MRARKEGTVITAGLIIVMALGLLPQSLLIRADRVIK
jgi:hypothetical protein